VEVIEAVSIDEAVSIEAVSTEAVSIVAPAWCMAQPGVIMAGSLADMHPIPHAGRDMAASIRAFTVAFIAAECTAVVFTAGEASIGAAVSTEAVAE
jgi:hypothetical protein